MAITGVLNTLVTADASAFERGLEQAGMKVGKFKQQVQTGSSGVQSALSNLGKLSGLGASYDSMSERVATVFGQVKAIVLGVAGAVASGLQGMLGPAAKSVAAEAGRITSTVGGVASGVSGARGMLSPVADQVATDAARIRGAVGSMAGSISGLSGASSTLGLVAGAIGLVAGAAIAAAAAALGFGMALLVMANHGAEAITQINRLSKIVGISVEALSGLSTLGGGDSFARSVAHMQRAIEDGSAAAGKALASMGLELGALRNQTSIQQIEAIYGSFNKIASQGERVSSVLALLGKTGIEMMESLSRGTAGLEAAPQKARDFGLEFTQEQANTVRRANKEWGNFGLAMKGIGQQAAIMFAPLWEAVGKIGGAVGKWLVSAFKDSMPLIKSVGSLIYEVVRALMLINPSGPGLLIAAFKDGGSSIGEAFTTGVRWATIFVDVLTAGVRVVGDIASAIWGGVWTAIKMVGQATGTVFEALGGWRTAIAIATGGLSELVRYLDEAFNGGRITAWFGAFKWSDLKDAAIGTMAALVVLAKNWRDVFVSAIDWIRLQWLKFQRNTLGVSGLDREIDAIGLRLAQVGANLGDQIRDQIAEWTDLLNGVGQAAAAAANTAQANEQTEQKAITGHEAAVRGSERDFSILNSGRSTTEQLQRSQLAINQQQLAIQQRQLDELRRAPRIRGIRR